MRAKEYLCISVRSVNKEIVKKYITNQEEVHMKNDFKDEK